MTRYIKLNAALLALAVGDALAAVQDTRQGDLIIAAMNVGDDYASQDDALVRVAKLNEDSHLGRTDWRLISREEAFALTDATRFNPACDAESLPWIKPDLYWTRTPGAAYASFAWSVGFSHGDAGIYRRNYYGLVLAVCGGAAAPSQ